MRNKTTRSYLSLIVDVQRRLAVMKAHISPTLEFEDMNKHPYFSNRFFFPKSHAGRRRFRFNRIIKCGLCGIPVTYCTPLNLLSIATQFSFCLRVNLWFTDLFKSNTKSVQDPLSPRRRVQQFQFVRWPDIDAPSDVDSVIEFVRTVRDTAGRRLLAPIVVHCRYISVTSKLALHVIIDVHFMQCSC